MKSTLSNPPERLREDPQRRYLRPRTPRFQNEPKHLHSSGFHPAGLVARDGHNVAWSQDDNDALEELRGASAIEAVEGEGLELGLGVGGRRGAVGGEEQGLVGFGVREDAQGKGCRW